MKFFSLLLGLYAIWFAIIGLMILCIKFPILFLPMILVVVWVFLRRNP